MAEKKKNDFSVKPAIEAGKVAYGNDEWENVLLQASALWTNVLEETDKLQQNNMVVECVSAVAVHFNVVNVSSPEQLVNSVEADPDNQQLFVVREMVTQGLAHALENGTDAQKIAVASGSESEIKKVIPKEMDIMARDVRNATVDPEIGLRVDELEYSLSSGPGTDSQNADAINEVINGENGIKSWIKNNKIKNDDSRRGGADRVISMLAQRENELRGSEQNSGISDLAQTLKQSGDAQERLARQQLLFNAVMEKKWFSDQLMSKGASSAAPQLWYIEKPSWVIGIEKMDDWIDIFETAGAWSNEVASRRKGFGADFKNNFEDIQKILLNRGVIPEKVMKFLYENSNLGFKEALELSVDELFVWEKHNRVKGLKNSQITSVEIPVFKYGKKKNIATGVMEYDKDLPSPEVKMFLTDSVTYKKDLAKKLAKKMGDENGTLKNYSEEQAMIAVSLAMDFLELGGTFELADTFRRFDDGSDALRTALRPDRKLLAKVAPGKEPEVWGGPLMQAALAINKYDSVEAVNWLKRRGLLPDILGSCVLNIGVEDDQGKELTLGEALKNKEDIKFKDVAGDFVFGMKKDGQLPAIDIWLYLSGKKLLDLKAYGPEIDAVISKWSADLRNAIKVSREYEDGVANVPDTLVAGAIAGSAGLWPVSYYHDGLYLRLPRVKGQIYTESYGRYTSEIIRTLALSDGEIDTLRKTFGIGNFSRMLLLDNLEALYALETDGSMADFVRKPLVALKRAQVEATQKMLGIT